MTARAGSRDRAVYQRLWGVVIIIVVGSFITVLFWEIRLSELKQFHEGFTNDAVARDHVVRYKLHDCLLVPEMLTQLFYASEPGGCVDPDSSRMATDIFRTNVLNQPDRDMDDIESRILELSDVVMKPMVPDELADVVYQALNP